MQKLQAGPVGAQKCMFSVAAGNLRVTSDCYFEDYESYTVAFEIILQNGKKGCRYLTFRTSEDAKQWKPRKRLGHFKRILRNIVLSEPHALLGKPWNNDSLDAFGLWLGPSVNSDSRKVCVVARPDGEGPWELRLFDAGKHRHLFSRTIPVATVPSPPKYGNTGRIPRNEPSPLRRGSEGSAEQTARRARAFDRRPSAVSQKSRISVRA
jgi:hypothetical protein